MCLPTGPIITPFAGFAGTSPARGGRKPCGNRSFFLPRMRGRWSEGPEGVGLQYEGIVKYSFH